MTEGLDNLDSYRRRFLTALGIGGVAAAIGGVRIVGLATAKSDDEAVTDEARWGMLIDTSKCGEGCNRCVEACNEENGLTGFDRQQTDAQWIRTLEVRDKQTGHVTSLPMLCQHCEHPPCVDVCPTGASFRRADGIVLVNKHTCIGCRYCMMACPYKARSFIHEELTDQKPWAPRGKGTVESCTFCVHRVDRGDAPACVEACGEAANGAMMFGNLNDPDSEIAIRAKQVSSRQIRADLNLNTAVRYEGI
ncbi:MAG: Hdr menaquinol oxidoreductase iron-sulfur subunit 1 [marine bacterium B5-7]|nr:MAG: Hdr menaquinol oxidoreductase iron-sulfur subunit 1 [marine bacterium B5-7]